MHITKTDNREVLCSLDIGSKDGFRGIIIAERECAGPVRKSMNRKWSHDGVAVSDVELTKIVKHGLGCLQYHQMADIVKAIHDELKRRNPIGVNFYTGGLIVAHANLMEVSGGEVGNFTSESGPREDAPCKP